MDDPSLILVGGSGLTPESARALAPGIVVRMMVYRPAIRPVDVGDVVEIVPGSPGRAGDLALCVHADRCEIGRIVRDDGSRVEIEIGAAGGRHALAASAVLGVASTLEQGDLLLDLRRRTERPPRTTPRPKSPVARRSSSPRSGCCSIDFCGRVSGCSTWAAVRDVRPLRSRAPVSPWPGSTWRRR